MVSLVGRLRASRRLLRAIRTRPTHSSLARLHRGGRFVPPFFFPAPVAPHFDVLLFGIRRDNSGQGRTALAIARHRWHIVAAWGESHPRHPRLAARCPYANFPCARL